MLGYMQTLLGDLIKLENPTYKIIGTVYASTFNFKGPKSTVLTYIYYYLLSLNQFRK